MLDGLRGTVIGMHAFLLLQLRRLHWVFFFLGRVNCTVMNRLQIVISVFQDRTFLESVAGGVECKLDSKRFFLTASVSFA